MLPLCGHAIAILKALIAKNAKPDAFVLAEHWTTEKSPKKIYPDTTAYRMLISFPGTIDFMEKEHLIALATGFAAGNWSLSQGTALS